MRAKYESMLLDHPVRLPLRPDDSLRPARPKTIADNHRELATGNIEMGQSMPSKRKGPHGRAVLRVVGQGRLR